MEALQINHLLRHLAEWQIVDVRSPGEFQAGHIPGAINLPLFTDEERARIGLLYRQASREEAMDAGLEIAGSKMSELAKQGRDLAKSSKKMIVVHCWRGGNRSKAMEWLLNFSGLHVYRLEDGYKSFRQALYQFFMEADFVLHILGGCTGSGKTEILSELQCRGEQVIDLEKLANHKGSAFGAIGEDEQPTNEQFENELFMQFLQMDLQRPIWIENESKNIGRIYMPEGLWNKMRQSVLYAIEVSRERRLERALAYYAHLEDVNTLKACFARIKKRLGGLEYQNAMKALDEHDLKTAASIALQYYDKSYHFQLANWSGSRVLHFKECDDIARITDQLQEKSKLYKPLPQ